MDPIADMLTAIRNAQAVKKETAIVPYSKIKMDIAEALVKEGFIKDVMRRGKKNRKIINIGLKYSKDGDAAISHITRVSKPSKRVYLPFSQIRKVQHGQGISVLTTPMGVLTNKDARKEKVGGEIICEVW